MQIHTVLLLIAAFLIALGLAVFHYTKSKTNWRLRILLTFLRFLTVFAALVLLINPEFVKKSYYTEKANLVILVDESSSIVNLEAQNEVLEIVEEVSNNSDLNDKYEIQSYGFSKTIRSLDSIDFEGHTTDIANTLETVGETFSNQVNTILLLTDGNATYGQDYEYANVGNQSALNGIIVGDTTRYEDVGVEQLNGNRYAFLDNQFPLEAQISYSGKSRVAVEAKLFLDGKVVHRERLEFSVNKRSHTLNALLKAQSTGIKVIRLEVTPLENEKNTINNVKQLAIEIIDEKTEVAIISSFKHPDLGALKKAIESNEQRRVSLLEPNVEPATLAEVDVFILYQPNRQFEPIYNFISNRGGGSFTITGPETDWNYLNRKLSTFSMEGYGQQEEILSVFNKAFSLFDISNFEMSAFPPLKGSLGELKFNTLPKIIAYQQIKGVNLETPLFFVFGEDEKQAFLLGSDIWKWRLATHRATQEFSNFDDFVGKLMFYLASSGKKERLQLEYENIFENSSDALVRATFFDESYSFKTNANLNLLIRNNEGFERTVPMLLSGNNFQADLSDLEEGDYSFTVTETTERISRSGQFKILNFDLEKQFFNSNHQKLGRLTARNSGSLFFADQVDELIEALKNDSRFLPVQKSSKNVVSLIDFRLILGLMALSLALEWFLRKYNGLI